MIEAYDFRIHIFLNLKRSRQSLKQRQKWTRTRPKTIPWDPEQRLCSKPGYIFRRTLDGPVLAESRHKMAELGPHRSDALLRKCKLHTPQNSQTRHHHHAGKERKSATSIWVRHAGRLPACTTHTIPHPHAACPVHDRKCIINREVSY